MTTTATAPSRLHPTVDRLLDAIGGGAGVPVHLLAADIVLDATGRWDAARLAEMAAADNAG